MFGLFSRDPNRALIDKLHGEIMAGVREPGLYLHHGVPDTFEGRFEMLALHGGLVIRRLEQLPPPGPDMAQDVTDGIFRHLDVTLREMGVGDVTVPKRMKKHAQAFAGRAHAYGSALAAGNEPELRAALARNVLSDDTGGDSLAARALARYALVLEAALARYDIEHFLAGRIGFPRPDATGAA